MKLPPHHSCPVLAKLFATVMEAASDTMCGGF